MDNTLFVFGDSFTQGHHNFETYGAYADFKKYRGGKLFDLWPTILSKKLNLDLENHGHAGTGNDDIFSSICENIDKIKKGDVVIIGWTFITRFRWVIENGFWRTIHGGPDDSISESTRKEILINRFNPRYAITIYEYEKIIDVLSKSVGFDVYYWSAENNLIYCLPNKNQRKYLINDLIKPGETLFFEIFRRGGKTIQEESNNTISDIHLGESGHKIQGELFYNYIMNIEEEPCEYVNLTPDENPFLTPHLAPNYDPVRIHEYQLHEK
jgi:hypothetical protein